MSGSSIAPLASTFARCPSHRTDYHRYARLGKVKKQALQPYFTSDNLFVISSDFSHYPSYEDANRVDKATGEAIESGSLRKFLDALEMNAHEGVPQLLTSACGQSPIAVLLLLMEGRKDLQVRHLAYCNSGDAVYGDKDRVVGYHSGSGCILFDRGRAGATLANRP